MFLMLPISVPTHTSFRTKTQSSPTALILPSTGDAHALTWLPKELPENVRIIVSTLEGRCLDALRSSEVTLSEVAVNPLDVSTRKDIISQILGEYNKSLDEHQVYIIRTLFHAQLI